MNNILCHLRAISSACHMDEITSKKSKWEIKKKNKNKGILSSCIVYKRMYGKQKKTNENRAIESNRKLIAGIKTWSANGSRLSQ